MHPQPYMTKLCLSSISPHLSPTPYAHHRTPPLDFYFFRFVVLRVMDGQTFQLPVEEEGKKVI